MPDDSNEERPHRRRMGRPSAAMVALIAGLLTAASPTAAPAGAPADGPFSICEKQRYALCAAAACLVYNQVAYCKCDVERGTSISEPFDLPSGDVCQVNKRGYGNGYMISTYSLPPSVVAGGKQAVYTCPGETSDGAYAQCDGGMCFTSTRGKRFPGFAKRLRGDEIICSCPITVAEPSQSAIGYQIMGPYPCQASFFDNCRRDSANKQTGSTIHVGAPTGVPHLLTEALEGSVPPLNHCLPPG